MGWLHFSEHDPSWVVEHEGWIVGLVPAVDADGNTSDWRFRELSSSAGDIAQVERPLRFVQVGCDCGWRSRRLEAPVGAFYWPSYVEVPQYFEDDCRALWREHVEQEATRRCARRFQVKA